MVVWIGTWNTVNDWLQVYSKILRNVDVLESVTLSTPYAWVQRDTKLLIYMPTCTPKAWPWSQLSIHLLCSSECRICFVSNRMAEKWAIQGSLIGHWCIQLPLFDVELEASPFVDILQIFSLTPRQNHCIFECYIWSSTVNEWVRIRVAFTRVVVTSCMSQSLTNLLVQALFTHQSVQNASNL